MGGVSEENGWVESARRMGGWGQRGEWVGVVSEENGWVGSVR